MSTTANTAATCRPETSNARTQFGRALLEQFVPKAIRSRLGGPGPYGIVILAATIQHVELLAEALDEITGDPLNVNSLEQRPTAGSATRLIDGLGAGKVVVAICHDLSWVPVTFQALADDIVNIGVHNAATLRRVLKKMMGANAPKLPRSLEVNPDPELLCRCLRPGLPPDRVVAALVRLGSEAKPRTLRDVPDLRTAVEFGEARQWGLQLKSDLAAWRAGNLDPRDLDTNILLVGPSGVGKTLFARALASSLQIPFIELRLGDTYTGEGHLGNVLQSLREAFARAEASSPAVLLMDELDSLGRRDKRDNNSMFTTAVINDVLMLVDGATQRKPGLIIIGATNDVHGIDPALRRPGRLGRTIRMQRPTATGVENILRFHLRADLKKTALDRLVNMTLGMTPAELMDLVRRSRQMARKHGRPIMLNDLTETAAGGPVNDPTFLARVAIHEVGHAMVCLLVPEAPMLNSITLVEDGTTNGRAWTAAHPGANTLSRIEGRIMMALGGKAAETIVYGDASDGAAQDLKQATQLACEVHGSLAMMGTFVSHEHPEALLATDKEFAERIDAYLTGLFDDTVELLEEYKPHIMAVASQLCMHRVLTGKAIVEIFNAIEDSLGAVRQARPRLTA